MHTAGPLTQPVPAWRWLLAWLAGAAQAASLAWPATGEPLWWLQMLSMAALAWLVLPSPGRPALTGRQGMGVGMVFGTAWLCGTFWWLYISMHTYGGLPAALAVLAVLGLAAFLASYYALALGAFCRLAQVNRGFSALLFASLWTLAELARGSLWTGFPWGAGGYAHTEGPLAALARSTGVYGVGMVSAALAMAGVQALQLLGAVRRAGWRLARAGGWAFGISAVLVAAAWQRECAVNDCAAPVSGSSAVSPAAQPLTLALLQGNIPQDEKFQSGSGVPLALRWYADALHEASARLVVAPETAIPLLPHELVPGYMEGLIERYRQGDQAALIGIPLGNFQQGYTNSVIGIAPGQGEAVYRYDKHHLVPFGEFIPPLFRWFTAMMNIPLGDFNRGAVGQASLAWAGQRLAPNICYEDLFGEELGARFVDPAQAPTVLVNVSNIGWFGDSVAIDQHLQISRMRTLEFERPMVRATNTGATAIIDHRGVVTHALPPHTRGVLTGEVQGRGLSADSGWQMTPYAWWVSRWGLWPLYLLCALVLGWALWRYRVAWAAQGAQGVAQS